MTGQPQPSTIHVPDETLADLRERLDRTRWPDAMPGMGWDDGMDRTYLQELVDYWRTGFDWRAQEAALNAFAHYRVQLDGLGLHFIHERGRGPAPVPLLLTHGWPSSFYEKHKIIPRLADPARFGGDPADACDVVVPSLPGYGFSDRPAAPGVSRRIPDLWVRLMTQVLGYARFVAHGVDIGAFVTNRLGLEHPAQVLGLHVTMVAEPHIGPGSPPLTEAERTYLEGRTRGNELGGGYAHLQRTTPQTPAYGLSDSPAGLAAWIVEKWLRWSGGTSGEPHSPVQQRRAADHGDALLGDTDHRLLAARLLRVEAGLRPGAPRCRAVPRPATGS